MKSAPVAAPTATADKLIASASPTPLLQPETGHETATPPEPEATTPATPRPNSATDNVASAVSATGAVTDEVHSGGGCTSSSGPFVKMREHPGLATRTSVANEMRSAEFTMPPKGPLSPGRLVDAPGETVFLNSFVGPHRGGDESVPNVVRIY